MKRRKLALAVLLAAVAALVGATAGSASRTSAYKVAWIYVGPHNDAGWSQAHDDGRLYVQKMLGSKVQTTYKENIAVGAQFSQTVASLAAQGYQMIFATSYGYVTKELAAKYPNIKFEQATGTDIAKNLSEYFGRAEDTVFLSGMAAGYASKTGVLGDVLAYPIPEVIRHANAFALGAQYTHPGATVRIVWTHSWYNPAAEKKAAEGLVAAGADVLGQNVDSPATGQYAESKGLPWVGYDSNASKFAPKSWLTASVYNWGIYYLKRVKEAMAGTWKAGFYYGTINDGFTKLSPYGPGVTAAEKAKIAAVQKQMENGTFYEFAGPLYDQSGKLRVAKGVKMDVLKGGTNSLYGMNWLVKGVIGSPKG
ncbi:MAG TPA: BMP family ABC transporter substrate-binding protein [Gaiellaceae bacterium]|nr:BMP family ABC transporter substrate-binding protein [Gaiellaceae bacterium]